MDKYLLIEIMKALRQTWSWYDPAKKAAKKRATIKIYQRKMDGTMGKRYTTTFKCEECGVLTDKVDTHHIQPVGKAPQSYEDLMVSIKRLFTTEDQLLILCTSCHKKTDSYGGKKK
jgi:hypothetical protein